MCRSLCKEGPNPILSTHALTMGKHFLLPIHNAETSMNSFRCLAVSAFYKSWEKNPEKQLLTGGHHYSNFNHEGDWGPGILGCLPRAAQESRSKLVMRLPGRRKVSGRMCPGFSGVLIHQASPLLEEQILRKGWRLGTLALPQNCVLDMEECFLIPI